MPKKPARSPIYYYADEYRKKICSGLKNLSIAEAIELAYPSWKALSAAEKAPYEQMYKRYKNEMKSSAGDSFRMNCLGKTLAETVEPLVESMNKRQKEVAKLYGELSSVTHDELLDMPFYFVHFNVFCITEDLQYVPAEFGISKWTLKCGLMKSYTCLVDPGRIPTGYYGECVENADSTHQIPVGGGDKENAMMLWIRLCNFVNVSCMSKTPKLFSLDCDCTNTNALVQWLRDNAAVKHRNWFKDEVYSAENLLRAFYQVVGKEIVFESATEILSDKAYCYKKGVCCDFHRGIDNTECSLSTTKHICYGMSMALCSLFNVPYDADHLPPDCA